MPNSGSVGFQIFSENLKRVCEMESELAQETAVRRAEFRASLINEALPSTNNLLSAYALYRSRLPGGPSSN
jgi:hypothetical protein